MNIIRSNAFFNSIVQFESFRGFRIAVCAIAVFAFGMTAICLAQSTYSPLVDTPSQRWLPPIRSYPDPPDRQAKLLSQLRDLVLNSGESKDANPTRLSDSEIQTLKDAMKQFGGDLPEGLSADSLDAIPTDLIAKALSNPELMRQAKELTEQYSKDKSSNLSKDRERVEPPISNANSRNDKQNDLPESQPQSGTGDSLNSRNKRPQPEQPTRPTDEPDSNTKPTSDDFAELIEKMRSTQQQFEKNQKARSETPSPSESTSSGGPTTKANKESPAPRSSLGGTEPLRANSSPSPAGSSTGRPNPSDRSVQPPNAAIDQSNPFDSKKNTPATQRKKADNLVPPKAKSEKTKSEKTNRESNTPTNQNPRSSSERKEASDSNTQSSMNIRQDLERKGFGPTFRKLVEDAQRAGQSSRVPAVPKPTNIETNDSRIESTNALSKNAESKRSESATTKQSPPNLPKPVEAPPRPPQPDSAFSKGLKQAGKSLSDFWSQMSKSESESKSKPASSSRALSPPAASGPSSTSDLFSLPNPFNARFLQGLLVLGVAIAIGYVALRYKVRSEQIRRETEEAQLATDIDTIRTRDDVVRAFHAMTKQRFQSAQLWWTNRFITEKFELSLPEHSSPIRTLSGIYEQARYFPMDHQLSSGQIEDAKLALKQCKG